MSSFDEDPHVSPPNLESPSAESPPAHQLSLQSKWAFRRRGLLPALAVAAAYLLFLQIVERLPGAHITIILVTTLASLLFTLVFTVVLAQGLRGSGALLAVGTVSFLAIVPSVLEPVLIRMHPEWQFWPGVLPHYHTYRTVLQALPGVDGLLMVACAVSIGVLISRVVREFKMLLPIAVVLAVVDMYVVFGGGLVTQAQAGGDIPRSLMNGLTVKLPTAHPATGALPMQLELGFADFLFIGLFFACFVKFGAPSRLTFMVLCFTLTMVMLFVALLDLAVPALVPIAVVVVGMNLRQFKFARDELFAMLYAGIIVAVIVVVLVIRSRLTPPLQPKRHALPAANVAQRMRIPNTSAVSARSPGSRMRAEYPIPAEGLLPRLSVPNLANISKHCYVRHARDWRCYVTRGWHC